jgi:hypothetical protein
MGEIGCYSMMLYCDSKESHKYREMPAEFTGRSREDCLKQARKIGWKISRTSYNEDGTLFCLCPKHSGK